MLADEEGGEVYAESNFGVRGAEGPPYFLTGFSNSTTIAGGWDPIYVEADAEAVGAKSFLLAALPHLVEDAVAGEDIVASPALEIAFPFSQFSFPAMPEVEVVEDVDFEMEPLILLPDENGAYVQPDDEWLFNICGYTDGITSDAGIGLVTWNDMKPGGFHNAPRGMLKFQAASNVNEWMMY